RWRSFSLAARRASRPRPAGRPRGRPATRARRGRRQAPCRCGPQPSAGHWRGRARALRCPSLLRPQVEESPGDDVVLDLGLAAVDGRGPGVEESGPPPLARAILAVKPVEPAPG